MPWETGSPSSWCGQYVSQISQVLRPSSSASARSNIEVRKGHISSSACAAVQPPRSNPPRRSSSGPPGPWYTPSTVIIIVAINFMVIAPSHRVAQVPRAAIADIERSATSSMSCYIGHLCVTTSRQAAAPGRGERLVPDALLPADQHQDHGMRNRAPTVGGARFAAVSCVSPG